MPIFEKNGRYVLFSHVPKAGGTTIEHMFAANGWARHLFDDGNGSTINPALKCSPQHWHATMLENVCNLSRMAYSFCIVRNPVDRILSEYRWRVKYFGVTKSADEWIPEALAAYAANPFVHDNHIRPQCEFIVAGMRVFRLESGVDAIVREISSALGIGLAPLQHAAMQSEGAGISDHISDQTRDAVDRFYRSDLDLWGAI